jgi:ABC-type nitrate/sulfonate/bicarbonate transport system substrate-binding protein
MTRTVLFSLLLAACGGAPPPAPAPQPEPVEPTAAPEPLRIGWQTTWATQGQLAQILDRTPLLRARGYAPELVGFTYGGPLNEGALAGEVDVVLTADQPAIMLCAKSPDWAIIGRLMHNRVGTFVPPDSTATSVSDLRGRTIAIPFGAAAQRETLAALREVGLDPSRDVRTVNLGIQEQVALVGAGSNAGRWGRIDAGSAWDPAFAELEHSGAVRVLAQGVVTSVVVMHRGYLERHPGADEAFLDALAEAYERYREDRDQADAWFSEAAGITFDPAVLALAASVEPNLQPGVNVRTTLNQAELEGLERAAAFMLEVKLLKEPADLGAMVAQPGVAGSL